MNKNIMPLSGLSLTVVVLLVISIEMIIYPVFASAKVFQYEAHGRRDPFVPLIGKEKPMVVRIEDVVSTDDLRLEGIAIGAKGERIAILNGEMLKEKRKIGDLEVKKITERTVTVSIGGQDHIIKLSEEGGRE